jgi:hypothetical protein
MNAMNSVLNLIGSPLTRQKLAARLRGIFNTGSFVGQKITQVGCREATRFRYGSVDFRDELNEEQELGAP